MAAPSGAASLFFLSATPLDSDGKICYTYDNLSRVTKKAKISYYEDECGNEYTEEDVKESFTYDAAGNVTGNKFSYDVNNRLISYNGKSVEYDADGNMLSDGENSYAYDSANRLISAGGHAYTYTAEDVRIKDLCNNVETRYIYDVNSNVLTVTGNNGTITRTYDALNRVSSYTDTFANVIRYLNTIS